MRQLRNFIVPGGDSVLRGLLFFLLQLTIREDLMQQFNTITQALAILNVSRPTLYRHIKNGKIPAVRLGGRVLIPADFFDELRSQASNKAHQAAAE